MTRGYVKLHQLTSANSSHSSPWWLFTHKLTTHFPFLSSSWDIHISVLLLCLAAWLSASKVISLSEGSMLSVLVWLKYFILGNSICIFFNVFLFFHISFPILIPCPAAPNTFFIQQVQLHLSCVISFFCLLGSTLSSFTHIVLWKCLCAPSLHTYKMSTPLKLWNIQITGWAKDTELNVTCRRLDLPSSYITLQSPDSNSLCSLLQMSLYLLL